MMAFFSRSLSLVTAFGPALLPDGVAGVFVKSLAPELRAAVAHVNDLALAALLFDRRDPIELLRLLGAGKAIPVGPKGDQKPRSHGWTRGRKAAEDRRVPMGVGGLLDPRFHQLDGLMQDFEHAGQRLSFEHGRLDQGWVLGQGLGFLDGLETFFQGFVTATIMAVKKLS